MQTRIGKTKRPTLCKYRRPCLAVRQPASARPIQPPACRCETPQSEYRAVVAKHDLNMTRGYIHTSGMSKEMSDSLSWSMLRYPTYGITFLDLRATLQCESNQALSKQSMRCLKGRKGGNRPRTCRKIRCYPSFSSSCPS